MDIDIRLPVDGISDRLSEEMLRVMEEVSRTGGKGRVTLSLEVKVEDRDLDSPLIVQASIKSTLPPRMLPVALVYFYDGDYHRSPKHQAAFPPEIYSIEEA